MIEIALKSVVRGLLLQHATCRPQFALLLLRMWAFERRLFGYGEEQWWLTHLAGLASSPPLAHVAKKLRKGNCPVLSDYVCECGHFLYLVVNNHPLCGRL